MNGSSLFLLCAGVLGAVGVALGAYQAHGLEALLASWNLPPDEVARRLAWCEVAVRYQLIHAAALLALAAGERTPGALPRTLAGGAFTLGVAIFSGCLFVMTFRGGSVLGAIVPIGGVLMIAGWVCVAVWGLAGCCRRAAP